MKSWHTVMINQFEIGTPNVEGAKVEADLIKNSKNRTILIFKKKEEDKIQEEKMGIDKNIL